MFLLMKGLVRASGLVGFDPVAYSFELGLLYICEFFCVRNEPAVLGNAGESACKFNLLLCGVWA